MYFQFSHYGSYERLTDDGLTQWHPAFLELGQSLDECAEKYRRFCNNYHPKSKTARKYGWGSRFLPHLMPQVVSQLHRYSGTYLGIARVSKVSRQLWISLSAV
ncbi:MAG: hypothetical protein DRR19_22380 [Candidatus Parabeggiatoa sp. nov. 1]|nr:MAG: hypothetical protein DRR19_22380 [Gammaproteobacteria bacterium]